MRFGKNFLELFLTSNLILSIRANNFLFLAAGVFYRKQYFVIEVWANLLLVRIEVRTTLTLNG